MNSTFFILSLALTTLTIQGASAQTLAQLQAKHARTEQKFEKLEQRLGLHCDSEHSLAHQYEKDYRKSTGDLDSHDTHTRWIIQEQRAKQVCEKELLKRNTYSPEAQTLDAYVDEMQAIELAISDLDDSVNTIYFGNGIINPTTALSDITIFKLELQMHTVLDTGNHTYMNAETHEQYSTPCIGWGLSTPENHLQELWVQNYQEAAVAKTFDSLYLTARADACKKGRESFDYKSGTYGTLSGKRLKAIPTI
jgi:hypothetical protein